MTGRLRLRARPEFNAMAQGRNGAMGWDGEEGKGGAIVVRFSLSRRVVGHNGVRGAVDFRFRGNDGG